MSASSRRVVLLCEECGEKTVLDGSLSAWRSWGDSFACECGKPLGSGERKGCRASARGRRA